MSSDVDSERRPRGPAGVVRWAWHCIRQHGLAVLVVACLVTLSKPLWAPVDDVVAGMAHAVSRGLVHQGDFAQTAIVKLQRDRFLTAYAGQSPLDRCALTKEVCARVLSRP